KRRRPCCAGERWARHLRTRAPAEGRSPLAGVWSLAPPWRAGQDTRRAGPGGAIEGDRGPLRAQLIFGQASRKSSSANGGPVWGLHEFGVFMQLWGTVPRFFTERRASRGADSLRMPQSPPHGAR
ncbi:unnamed protein product, partial [Amoebophrya sp. A120]